MYSIKMIPQDTGLYFVSLGNLKLSHASNRSSRLSCATLDAPFLPSEQIVVVNFAVPLFLPISLTITFEESSLPVTLHNKMLWLKEQIAQ